MHSVLSRIILRLNLRPIFVRTALFFAMTGFAGLPAYADLSPKSLTLIQKIDRELPGHILGLRSTQDYMKSYFHWKLTGDGDIDSLLATRCETLLATLDPDKKIDRNGSLESIQSELYEIYLRDRLQGILPAVQEFNQLTPQARAWFLRDILKNAPEAAQNLKDKNLERILKELLSIPYDQIQQKITDPSYARHWAGAHAGPEIDSRFLYVYRINKALSGFFSGLKGRMVDIGSGYGVPGIYFTLLNPKLTYLGLEIVPEKIETARDLARRFGLENALDFSRVDLSDEGYRLPEANYYYAFNPVHPEVTNRLLRQLNEIGLKKKIIVILVASWGQTDLLNNFKRIHYDENDGIADIAIFQSQPR